MGVASAVANMVARFGSTCSITRPGVIPSPAEPWKNTDPAPPPSLIGDDVPCSIRFYKPKEIVGLVQEGDQLLTIPGASLASAPLKGDRVQVDGGPALTVVSTPYSRREGASIAVYKIQLRGGG